MSDKTHPLIEFRWVIGEGSPLENRELQFRTSWPRSHTTGELTRNYLWSEWQTIPTFLVDNPPF